MPTRFDGPHRDRRWRPILISRSGSTRVCRPGGSRTGFLRCYRPKRSASLSVQNLVATGLFAKDEPSDNRIHIRRRKVSIPREADWNPVSSPILSLNFVAPEDDDRRTIRHERAIGQPLENYCQFASVESARITLECRFRRRTNLPSRVRYAIFERFSAPLSCITPIVFGDELFHAPLPSVCRLADGPRGKRAPFLAHLPSIFRRPVRAFRFNPVLHRKVYILLPVHHPSRRRNCSSGHDLRNEDDTSSKISTVLATDVEAEIHLIKSGVKRY